VEIGGIELLTRISCGGGGNREETISILKSSFSNLSSPFI